MGAFRILGIAGALILMAVIVFSSGLFRTVKTMSEEISEPEKAKLVTKVETTEKRVPSTIKMKAELTGGITKEERKVVEVKWIINGTVVSTKLTASYNASEHGEYDVVCKVKNQKGEEFESVNKVEINKNNPPVCELSYPNPIYVGRNTVFTARCNDVDGKVVKYVWDYGDDSPKKLTNRHTYTQPGVYLVTMTAYDNSGDAGVAQAKVSVH